MDDEDLWGEEPDWFGDNDPLDENDDANNNNDESKTTPIIAGAQHVLVLMDCHPNMFTPTISSSNDDDDDDDHDEDDSNETNDVDQKASSNELVSPVHVALKACEKLVRRQIRTIVTKKVGKRDGFGILLYGKRRLCSSNKANNNNSTENTNPDKDEDSDDDEDDDDDNNNNNEGHFSTWGTGTSTQVLLPLAPPGVDAVHTIQSCWKSRDLKSEYVAPEGEEEIDDDDDLNLHQPPLLQTALQQALYIFRNSKCVRKYNNSSSSIKKGFEDKKSIWIVTNQQDPLQFHNNNNINNSNQNSSTNTQEDRQRQLVIQCAKDIQEHGISIMVIPFADAMAGGKSRELLFDLEPFYKEILTPTAILPGNDQRIQSIWECEERLEELHEQWWKKIRRAFYAPLLLPDWKDCFYNNSKKNDDATDNSDNNDKIHDPGIMVDFYRIIQLARKPTFIDIHQETGMETEKVIHTMLDNGELLVTKRRGARAAAATTNRDDIDAANDSNKGENRLRYFGDFAGDYVPMKQSDLTEIKQLSTANQGEFAYLILLGFKKQQNDRPFLLPLDQSYFIYPNEEMIEGSTVAFAHLYRATSRQNVMAIGELLIRRNASSRLVAIYPLASPDENNDDQEEEHNNSNSYHHPQGMVVVSLPFEDEVRALDDMGVEWLSKSNNNNNHVKSENDDDVVMDDVPSGGDSYGGYATEESVQAAMELVRKQDLNDREIGYDFENANLLRFWDYIERIALTEETTTTVATVEEDGGGLGEEDYDIQIDEEDLLKALGEQIQNFESSLPPLSSPEDEDNDDEDDDGRYRRTGGGGRKRKTIPLGEDDTGIDWDDLYRTGNLSSCTVAQLKTKLRSLGERVSGRKDDLILRISRHLEQ